MIARRVSTPSHTSTNSSNSIVRPQLSFALASRPSARLTAFPPPPRPRSPFRFRPPRPRSCLEYSLLRHLLAATCRRVTASMQAQLQVRPNSAALDHWVSSGEAPIEPAPPSPLSQVAYDAGDHHSNGGGSSSGHHSHEASLEHGLALPNPPSLPQSSGLSLAFQSSPRSFDFRASGGSQPSSLRTSFSSYGNSDEALDSLRRSYSTTSDIRGTLEETRLDADPRHPAEQWSMNSGSFVSLISHDLVRAILTRDLPTGLPFEQKGKRANVLLELDSLLRSAGRPAVSPQLAAVSPRASGFPPDPASAPPTPARLARLVEQRAEPHGRFDFAFDLAGLVHRNALSRRVPDSRRCRGGSTIRPLATTAGRRLPVPGHVPRWSPSRPALDQRSELPIFFRLVDARASDRDEPPRQAIVALSRQH